MLKRSHIFDVKVDFLILWSILTRTQKLRHSKLHPLENRPVHVDALERQLTAHDSSVVREYVSVLVSDEDGSLSRQHDDQSVHTVVKERTRNLEVGVRPAVRAVFLLGALVFPTLQEQTATG